MVTLISGLREHEIEALTSLCFNIGPDALAGSTAIRLLREEDRLGAARAFLLWRKAGGKVVGHLVRRRHLEAIWFLGAPAETLHHYASLT